MATLREIREENYISRQQLADASGVSHSSIVRIEEGTNRTRQDVAEKVVQALSQLIGKPLTLQDVDGLNLYNIMRDRRQRGKARTKNIEQAA